jgi:hypothetical protein
MSDRDAHIKAILRIARDVSPEGEGIAINEAVKRVSIGYRTTFKADDLRPFIEEQPTLIDEWLRYSENKRTREGWYVLRNGEVGRALHPQSRLIYASIQEAVAEFVLREFDYWVFERDEFPSGWSKTLTDLIAEAEKSRQPIGAAEGEWARAYERGLLRSWARFPVDGDVYEALDDTPILFLTHWRAPFTDGGRGTLPKGTRVRVKVSDWMREPLGVYAYPLDGSRIERLLVSEEDRKAAKYSGFSLSIRTADLNRLFRLVPGGDVTP